MAHCTLSTHVAAPPERVFALWTALDRMGEWVGGVTGVTDVSGPIDQVGTTYVVHFGPMKSRTEILEVDPPRRFATRFGNWVLCGRSSATFEPDGEGTRVTQEFETVGLISASRHGSSRAARMRAASAVSSRSSRASPNARCRR